MLTPSDSQVVVAAGSSLTISCSGSGLATWRFRRQEDVPLFRVEQRNSSAVLILENVTWEHTGVYVCLTQAEETEEVAVFVPG